MSPRPMFPPWCCLPRALPSRPPPVPLRPWIAAWRWTTEKEAASAASLRVSWAVYVPYGQSSGKPRRPSLNLRVRVIYCSPSISPPFILTLFKTTLDYKTNQFGPKVPLCVLNDLYFKTTCNIRPLFLRPMDGLKVEGLLYCDKDHPMGPAKCGPYLQML